MIAGDQQMKASARSPRTLAMPKDARIFIAGASGMVGSAIVRKLLAMGYTNLSGSYHSRQPDASAFFKDTAETVGQGGVNWVQVDLTDQAAVMRFFAKEQAVYVFLAAARVGGIHANNRFPAQFIYDNLTIQGNMIHAAFRTGVQRLLFLGSSCIYPKLAPQPMHEDYLLTGLLEPTNEPYAIAKIAGIKMCEAYNRQYGTQFMAVMPTNLYGTNDNFDLDKSHVLPAMIRKFHLAKLAAKGDWEGIRQDEACFGRISADIKARLGLKPSNDRRPQPPSVVLWGTGSPRREFLHVDDMADACVFAMNLDDRIAATELFNYPKPCFVNVGTGNDCTIRTLARIIGEAVGFDGKVIFDSTKPDGTPRKLLDVSRLADLGWRSSISLADGIRRTYQWYLDRGHYAR
jgi:GDP-L-fucose synthase